MTSPEVLDTSGFSLVSKTPNPAEARFDAREMLRGFSVVLRESLAAKGFSII
jgi:hypothetical protein